ncbi:(2Fe-2S)-binding protein [Propionivibrio sp.]|uniref:(2Fe-2S)-binding protein n=1 Tax=Propionivibrio sp. TaxID=2212460 RepID=UPI0025E81DF9|nr:(2Fe-2S)-binding protein [Propionivibrio sp.]MBK7356810.1 (2Fe-2S)-binding protein [Propionivibrio sp.]MBK8401782.1 (2Fe-2S)-binding protein [Propionivibrio sp.]MBK8744506.1 (2Fe-2S)-binding protein [Propionivibrio sp.]MBK8894988.1 (2Fe-2S)-binding protein [Propionivibrio sp.]MBL0208249.1 (2Fe-2S)-binding protein [Propionivibrio sp.]
MYVCVCMAVTDRQIHAAAQEGARSLKDLRRLLGVTSECGHCATYARQCLQEANEALRESPRDAGLEPRLKTTKARRQTA